MRRSLLPICRVFLLCALGVLGFLCGELVYRYYNNWTAIRSKAAADAQADVARLEEAVRTIEAVVKAAAEDLAALSGDEAAVRARLEETFKPERKHYAAAVVDGTAWSYTGVEDAGAACSVNRTPRH